MSLNPFRTPSSGDDDGGIFYITLSTLSNVFSLIIVIAFLALCIACTVFYVYLDNESGFADTVWAQVIPLGVFIVGVLILGIAAITALIRLELTEVRRVLGEIAKNSILFEGTLKKNEMDET